MNLKNKKHALAWVSLLILAFLSGAATAQMRTECGADPTKPGACFVELDNGLNGLILCGDAGPLNDNLNEGLFAWAGINGENGFVRVNPDGTLYIHQSDAEVAVAYCTWQSVFAGTCGNFVEGPGPDAWLGTASAQANGVVGGGGGAQCPFHLVGDGEVTSPDGETTIAVRPTLHLVPDNENGGCKLQRCEILKPGTQNNGS